METVIIDDVPFEPNADRLAKRLRVRPGSSQETEFNRLVAEAAQIAHPKALYGVAFVSDKRDDAVVVEGVTFTSRVLRVNLDPVFRVFPHTATCGVELDEWSAGLGDLLQSYWSEAIRESALRAASQLLYKRIVDTHGLGKSSTMSPGSIGDWPLHEQKQLFRLLGDTESAIGVRLTDSCLMLPTKSVSGIRFPTETRFESCQLCPRDTCPGRRAPYEVDLFDRRYRQTE